MRVCVCVRASERGCVCVCVYCEGDGCSLERGLAATPWGTWTGAGLMKVSSPSRWRFLRGLGALLLRRGPVATGCIGSTMKRLVEVPALRVVDILSAPAGKFSRPRSTKNTQFWAHLKKRGGRLGRSNQGSGHPPGMRGALFPPARARAGGTRPLCSPKTCFLAISGPCRSTTWAVARTTRPQRKKQLHSRVALLLGYNFMYGLAGGRAMCAARSRASPGSPWIFTWKWATGGQVDLDRPKIFSKRDFPGKKVDVQLVKVLQHRAPDGSFTDFWDQSTIT